MWKNNHMPKLLKTQLLTSVLLLACFLLVIGSYSWFSNNRKTDGKENQIITEEESDAILGDYTIFMRSTKEGSDGNTIKSYTVSVGSVGSYVVLAAYFIIYFKVLLAALCVIKI